MASLPAVYYTPEQYLELERSADHKSEYYSGQIFSMAGASEAHNIITVNLSRELSLQLRGRPCRTYSGDMRIRVSATGLYTYPDNAAVCGERKFDDKHTDTLTNPNVIIEVLSPSTELYDRGEKFAHYRRLPSLTDYILISQDKMRIEHYTRQDETHWLLTEATEPQDEIVLRSIECRLALSSVYENVEFAAPSPINADVTARS
ncbi:MAG: Uma2 family endonuclease [Capsulimonas sp.]|uniref:Uma2 family endonuclease n=1 Tax=Capsulimonas sp. TaxID=2494211 RepID=UPI003262CD7D